MMIKIEEDNGMKRINELFVRNITKISGISEHLDRKQLVRRKGGYETYLRDERYNNK